jgi:hypothetical protein
LYAQHPGHKFVREGQGVLIEAVVHAQDPAAAARFHSMNGIAGDGLKPLECLLAVAAVLFAVVHPLVPLALRFGNAPAAITMMRVMPSILAVAFRNSFVASVGHVPLLLFAAVVVVPSGHGSPLCSMRCRWVPV